MPAGLYEILRVGQSADFQQIKRAYYRRAKECHPDRHGGDRGKEEEFKQLVAAFNVLSDPLQRRRYDSRLGTPGAAPGAGPSEYAWQTPEDRDSILDTHADDALEELIVGNTIPRDSTLATLMLDLERTERFCLFREAKTCYYNRDFKKAHLLFAEYLHLAPHNILGHYFLAKCFKRQRRWGKAERELRQAVRIGECRIPPLRLSRIRRELDRLSRQHGGILSRVRRALAPQPNRPVQDPDELLRRQVSRSINRLAAKKRQTPARRRLK